MNNVRADFIECVQYVGIIDKDADVGRAAPETDNSYCGLFRFFKLCSGKQRLLEAEYRFCFGDGQGVLIIRGKQRQRITEPFGKHQAYQAVTITAGSVPPA